MVLELPEADASPLAHPPLELVVCQLRFEERVIVADPRVILAIQAVLAERAGDPFSKLEPVKRAQLEIAINPQGSGGQTQVLATGWRLRSDDSRWTVTVMPDHVIVETTRYPGWSEGFRPVLHALLGAVADHIQPSIEQRLGLRYINSIRVDDAESTVDWRLYIAPRLLGVLGDEVIGPHVQTTQQQFVIEVDDKVLCSVRHGLVSDETNSEAPSYVLDFDVYRDHGQPFDAGSVKLASDNFNDFALRLFHASITHTLLERLRTA